MDKWVYPFASGAGATRTSAPVFGAVGNLGTFDDRDGQFFIGFDISGAVPIAKGPANYVITSAKLTLQMTFNAGDVVTYDPTYDSRSTYDPSSGEAINGDDPGRPIELYGAAYRNGLTNPSVREDTAFAPPGDPTREDARNIYATDYFGRSTRDVSNNIRDAFDPVPFAIGKVAAADLNADGTIKGDVPVTFTLNLLNPDVVSYLQRSLDEGRINLLATSLTTASQDGPTTYPEFYTKESGLAGVPGQLDLEVQILPEPNAAGLLTIGAGFLVSRRKRRALLPKEVLS